MCSSLEKEISMSNIFKNTVVLFRNDGTNKEECDVCKLHFNTFCSRMAISRNSLVIPRYSCLPYYKELENDLKYNNSVLINSYAQHKWIADFEYYEILKEYTFETWERLSDTNYEGPFVVKGKTNSRKHEWDKMMFAENRRDAAHIATELSNDSMIGYQDIIYRKYIPLKTFEIGIHGLRFTNEWRLFFLGGNLIDYGYYWGIADKPELGYIDEEAFNLAKKIAEIVKNYVNFFVLDIAEKEDGGWILVEINDGSMSGLSTIEPDLFYKKLFTLMQEFHVAKTVKS